MTRSAGIFTHRWLAAALALAAAHPAAATPQQGGRGLVYVHSATTLAPGSLEFFAGTRYFGKVANFGASKRAYTLWDIQSGVSFNYGAGRHVELALTPVLYQDVNRQGGNFWKGKANFPDDLFLTVKAGSFQGLESPWVFGGMLTVRIPTAKVHNVIYESYSAGRVEAGLTALASYFRNTAFPDMGWSVHANLGFLNHNDVGKSLSPDPEGDTPGAMTSEVLAGLGVLVPAGSFDFSAEITARYFLTRPPETAYMREYTSYLSFGVVYRHNPWLSFEMGFDKSLFMGEDLTVYDHLPPKAPDFPNMPGWRGLLGMKAAILPWSIHASGESGLRQKAKDRQAILEKMIENQSNMETAEQELTRIQAEREKVEEELERLRKLLEAEKQDNP